MDTSEVYLLPSVWTFLYFNGKRQQFLPLSEISKQTGQIATDQETIHPSARPSFLPSFPPISHSHQTLQLHLPLQLRPTVGQTDRESKSRTRPNDHCLVSAEEEEEEEDQESSGERLSSGCDEALTSLLGSMVITMGANNEGVRVDWRTEILQFRLSQIKQSSENLCSIVSNRFREKIPSFQPVWFSHQECKSCSRFRSPLSAGFSLLLRHFI